MLLCMSYKIPMIVIVTKIDMAPPELYKKVKKNIKKRLKKGAELIMIKPTIKNIN